MTRLRPYAVALTVILWASAGHAGRGTLAREVLEGLLRRFGPEVEVAGREALERRIGAVLERYGDDAARLVKEAGPEAIGAIERHGATALRVLEEHGAEALFVLRRPELMAIVERYGERAAAALIRHPGVAEPIIACCGEAGVRALAGLSPREARRLAMMLAGEPGALKGRAAEVLQVIGHHGARAVEFIWTHKAALAVGTTLAAFLADPEPFIEGTRDLAQIAVTGANEATRTLVEATVHPAVDAAAHAVEAPFTRTNWTVVWVLVITLLAAAWLAPHVARAWRNAHPNPSGEGIGTHRHALDPVARLGPPAASRSDPPEPDPE